VGRFNPAGEVVKYSRPLKLTLPNNCNAPSQLAKFLLRPAITSFIRLNFFCPPLGASRRPSKVVAIVAMPEASVDEDRDTVTWKNEIGATRESTIV
jgi:hypothetical protein